MKKKNPSLLYGANAHATGSKTLFTRCPAYNITKIPGDGDRKV